MKELIFLLLCSGDIESNPMNGKTEKDLDNLNIISNECTKLTLDSKEKHVREMSEKLNGYLTALKTYWQILNRK